MKDQLASWRHSAETATIERRSKVIDGRIRDVRHAEKRRMKPRARSRQKRKSQPLSAFAVSIGKAGSPLPEFFSTAPHRKGNDAAFATFLPASELEQSAFVAFSSKNGPHRASSRLQGNPTLERVEGQFNEYRSGAGTG
jgi:hypothetical protein